VSSPGPGAATASDLIEKNSKIGGAGVVQDPVLLTQAFDSKQVV
jgi:hypothetical protein